MVGNELGELFEPEQRKLCEYSTFIGNRRREYYVKCGEPVGGDDEQAIAQLVDVAPLAAGSKFQPGKIRLRYHCVHLRRSHGNNLSSLEGRYSSAEWQLVNG